MNKKNRRRLTAFAIQLLCVAFYAQSALADSLNVKIRQINPDSATEQVTCAYQQKCSLQLAINHDRATAQKLSVNIQYVPSMMIFQFEGKDGFFYSADQDIKDGVYNVFWPQMTPEGTSTYRVTLFLPAVSHPEKAPLLSMADEAARQAVHTPIATLEITATSGP